MTIKNFKGNHPENDQIMKALLAKSASAGSGKTTALVLRYITLLLMGAKPGEIVALTFTVKAANNMKERVIKALSQMSSYEHLDTLAQELKISKEETLQKAKQLAENISFSQMKISTLDSFFSSILSKFCFYAGVPYGFETLESADLNWLRRKFLASLTSSQKIELALYLSSHKRKLGYFFELFALFDEKNLDPESLFTLHELQDINLLQRAKSLTLTIQSELYTEREIGLFEFTDLDNLASKKALLNENICEHTWLKKKTFSQNTLDAFDELKTILKYHFWQKENTYANTIASLFASYQNTKHKWMNRDGKLSFSDISTNVHTLLCSAKSIDTDFLYFRLDSKINHILIDEFQDTSLLQYEIIRPLINEIASGSGQSSFASFFFVGDVKQSIYRFRGGNSWLFDHVASTLKPNGLAVEYLNTNYRSDKNIVKFSNDVFSGVMPSYKMQEPNSKAAEGFVQVITAPAPSDEDEATLNPLIATVLEKINLLISHGANEDDIAVLTPTNADSITVIEAISEHTKLRATQEVSARLIEHCEAKSIINYIKYCFYGEEIFREIFLSNLDAANFANVIKIDLNKPLADVISSVMEMFHLHSVEALKLLEISSKYGDIYDFVTTIESDNTKSPGGESHGVRVLTIHKSKGLEFKYVICMDRMASRGQSGDDILFEYDGVATKRAFFRFSGRENYDSEYKNIAKAQEDLASIDLYNMLYVAFTRAEHAMFIIKKATNIKKDGSQGSYSGIFELPTLHETQIGVLQIEQSNKQVSQHNHAVAFALKNHGRQKLDDTAQKNENNYKKIELGLALHSALELVDFESATETTNRSIEHIKKRYNFENPELEQLTSMVELGFKRIKENYTRKDNAFFKECAFIFDGKQGRIDLLVISPNQAFIVDYKSSSAIMPNHEKQITKYADAVKAITNIETQTEIVILDCG